MRRSAAFAPRCAPAATGCAHTLLSWLPDDLRGARLLDAGCGTGALSIEAARRGAQVVAIDVAPTLDRSWRRSARRAISATGRIDFRVGDMLDPALGTFDHVVAMDSLIHYRAADCVGAVPSLAARTGGSIVFTFAPRTPALAAMHAVGRLFPRTERAPAIEPVRQDVTCSGGLRSEPGACRLVGRRAPSASSTASTPRRRWRFARQ